MAHRVVIIGQFFNNRLAILRPLGELGYDISVIALERKKRRNIDSYSRYVSNYYLCSKDSADDLLTILLTKCVEENQKVILIPIDDFSVYVLDHNYAELKQYFILPNIHDRQGAVVEWMDKNKQKGLAREIGLQVADSKSLSIVDGSYDIPSNILYPCFIKPQSFTLKAKKVLHRCDNEMELKKTLDSISRQYANIVVMIEDYKRIEREYAVVGVSNGCEVIIPGVIEIMSMGRGTGTGVAKTGCIVPITEYERLIEKFKIFVQRIGFVGIFDVDFYLCDNQFYFGELNLRYGGSGFVIFKKGINLPGMLVRSLLGESIGKMQKYIVSSSTYTNEKVCLGDWYGCYMTTKAYYNTIKSSDFQLISDKEDPEPEKAFKRYFAKMFIKRIFKKTILIIINSRIARVVISKTMLRKYLRN